MPRTPLNRKAPNAAVAVTPAPKVSGAGGAVPAR
jgi:hypothetical protein